MAENSPHLYDFSVPKMEWIINLCWESFTELRIGPYRFDNNLYFIWSPNQSSLLFPNDTYCRQIGRLHYTIRYFYVVYKKFNEIKCWCVRESKSRLMYHIFQLIIAVRIIILSSVYKNQFEWVSGWFKISRDTPGNCEHRNLTSI